MQKAARRRLSAVLASLCAYFEAAVIAACAAAFAEDAASIADEAADIAELIAAEAASVAGAMAGVVAGAAGVVVVVVVSSFLLHAANETAAAKVTISSAVFMFLLDIKVRQLTGLGGNLLAKSPIVLKTWIARATPVPNPRL